MLFRSVCAFISLFTCLFCLPICDFDLSFYMYVCMNIYTKWKTYLEFHNEFFFFFGLYFAPHDPKFWFHPWVEVLDFVRRHIDISIG